MTLCAFCRYTYWIRDGIITGYTCLEIFDYSKSHLAIYRENLK